MGGKERGPGQNRAWANVTDHFYHMGLSSRRKSLILMVTFHQTLQTQSTPDEYNGKSTEVERFTEKLRQGLVPQVRGSTGQVVLDSVHALTKYHSLGDLHSKKHLFLTVLEAQSASQHPSRFANGLLSSCYILTWQRGKNRLSGFFL